MDDSKDICYSSDKHCTKSTYTTHTHTHQGGYYGCGWHDVMASNEWEGGVYRSVTLSEVITEEIVLILLYPADAS